MNSIQRFLIAGLAYFVLLVIISRYDIVMSLEVGLLSIFGTILFRQTCRWWKTRNEGNGAILGIAAIFLIGAFFYIELVAVSGYVAAASTSMQVSSRLREIAIAMHNWHNDHHALPPIANYSMDGQPLLSWRVHLLPYLGQEALYKQFRLDEAWDSPHNFALLSVMPDCYRLPQYCRQAPLGGTFYQLIVGPGAVFEKGKQITLGQLATESRVSSTIIAGIAEADVPWTKPADLNFDKNLPLALGRNMSDYPTTISRLLPWWKGEPGESNRSYRVLIADASIRGIRSNRLKNLAPYIIWRGEKPQDDDVLD